jgi:hypothetical protein
MSNNVISIYNGYDIEKVKVYRELFPKLITSLKSFLIKEYNFVPPTHQLDENCMSLCSRWGYDISSTDNYIFYSTRIDNKLPLLTVEFNNQDITPKDDKSYTIKINAFTEKEIVKKISGWFGSKDEVSYQKEWLEVCALHIQPENFDFNTKIGVTYQYSDSHNKFENISFDAFFEAIDQPDIILSEDFDVSEAVEDIEEIIDEFHEIVEKEYAKRITSLDKKQSTLLSSLDTDGNGEVDLIDCGAFNELLLKYQSKIIEIDKSYIQKFVKISAYLKQKKNNTQKIYDSIRNTKNENELTERISLLKNQIHTYNLLVFHSISMVTASVENDLITFYEIYECFDQLGVFNSNWENEISSKLSEIGDGIHELLYSIYRMERNIVTAINNLTYVNQRGFEKLNATISSELSSINSSINFGNLLNTVQTYQLYKLNE